MKKLVLAATAALGLSFAGQAFAHDRFNREINLVNLSDQSIVGFLASNVGSGIWTQDLLGRYVVDPGEYAPLDLDDDFGYCRFDFRTVMDDGTVVDRYGVNICELVQYVIR